MARMSFEDYSAANANRSSNQKGTIRYFSLKDDGESAIVRFNIHAIDDIAVDSVHHVKTAEGKTRVVSCLRPTPSAPIVDCPLCDAGEPLSYRLFIPLVEYKQVENGGIELTPSVWEQGVKTRNVLKGLIDEYGDLSNSLFKITRHGAKGSKETTYSILPANPNIYKDELFVRDLSAFDDPTYMNRFVLVKTAEEIEQFYKDGDFPNPYKKEEVPEAPKASSGAFSPSIATSPVSSNEPIRGTYETPATGNGNGPRRYTY